MGLHRGTDRAVASERRFGLSGRFGKASRCGWRMSVRLVYEPARFRALLGDVSREIQGFAAEPQNLAKPGFEPRTFGL